MALRIVSADERLSAAGVAFISRGCARAALSGAARDSARRSARARSENGIDVEGKMLNFTYRKIRGLCCV